MVPPYPMLLLLYIGKHIREEDEELGIFLAK